MTAYRRVYDSHHVQADCQEPGSAPDAYARQSNMGYLYFLRPTQLQCVYRCAKTEALTNNTKAS